MIGTAKVTHPVFAIKPNNRHERTTLIITFNSSTWKEGLDCLPRDFITKRAGEKVLNNQQLIKNTIKGMSAQEYDRASPR